MGLNMEKYSSRVSQRPQKQTFDACTTQGKSLYFLAPSFRTLRIPSNDIAPAIPYFLALTDLGLSWTIPKEDNQL